MIVGNEGTEEARKEAKEEGRRKHGEPAIRLGQSSPTEWDSEPKQKRSDLAKVPARNRVEQPYLFLSSGYHALALRPI